MSKINEMIKELCPNGVERVKLGEVCTCITGGDTPDDCVKGQKEPTADNPYPVYANGDEVYGYASHYIIDKPAVTISSIGNVGTAYYREPFFIPIIRLKTFIPNDINLNVKFLYYCLSTMTFIGTNSSLSSMKAADFKKREIPLPPIPIQQEIVNILDKFSSLIDNLDETIQLRQKQYEYYRDHLFGKDITELSKFTDYEINTISDLGSLTRGKRFVRTDIVDKGVPCIHYGDIYTFYGLKTDTAKTYITEEKAKSMRFAKKGDVVIVGAGENDWDIGVGLVWLGEDKAAIHDACYILEHKQNPMYISHYLRSTVYHLQLRKYVSSGKISSFSSKDLGKILIPVPSIERQKVIVNILDTFESAISNLKQERELRQKQYEYYREKLLTFE